MIELAWGTRLSVLALSGQLASYGLAIILARQLGVEGFESYVVASATFILLVSLVPQGLEKYALKLVPASLERGEAGMVHGFVRFARRRILLGSLVVGTAVVAWVLLASGLAPETRTAILVSCVFLAPAALVHLALEVLTALGGAHRAAVIFRLVVPGTTLLLVVATLATVGDISASWAIAAWGLSWCVALALMERHTRPLLVRPVIETASAMQVSGWSVAAAPFWAYRIAIAVLAQAGILALEFLQPSANAVGAFAVAVATASIARILATATNRVYASRLSVLLERGDMAGIRQLRIDRLRWLAVPVTCYLVLSFLFARELVGLFRPEFVDDGAPALRILAVSTAISTLLAMAPTYLKFQARNTVLFRQVAVAAVVQVLLLVWLVPTLGAVGAALAYGVASTYMYGRLAWLAHRGLANRMPEKDPGGH